MFRRILVPVDGSPTSKRGLAQAIKVARAHKSRLVLLHVVDERPAMLAPELGAVQTDRLMGLMRDAGKDILAKSLAAARKRGVKATTILVESFSRPVAGIIVAHARRSRADVIVLGTHGRRGISRLVMGSDAEGVVRTAAVPVLLVRAPARRSR